MLKKLPVKLKKTIDKLKKKESPPLLTTALCIIMISVSLFILFLNSFSINQTKAIGILDFEISQIRSECVEPYEREEGKFKIKVTMSEENVVTVSWKTFFIVNDSYSYSFIPTKICSN